MSDRVVGVVLAGGASRRMGRDKARLEVDGTTLAARAAERLGKVCAEVLLADGGKRSVPGLRSIRDRDGAGPIAGILAAAELYPDRDLLVLACDLPQVPVALLERLVRPFEGDALVPRWRRGIEPLCARYRPAALAGFAERAESGRYALHRLLEEPVVRYLEAAELERIGPPEHLFLNLNRPADLERLGPPSGSRRIGQSTPSAGAKTC